MHGISWKEGRRKEEGRKERKHLPPVILILYLKPNDFLLALFALPSDSGSFGEGGGEEGLEGKKKV